LEDLTGFRRRLQAIITPYSIDFHLYKLYENLSGLIWRNYVTHTQIARIYRIKKLKIRVICAICGFIFYLVLPRPVAAAAAERQVLDRLA
jgi:hypothetical protein